MQSRGWNEAELSRLINVSPSTVNRWLSVEKPKRPLTVIDFLSLAAVLDIDTVLLWDYKMSDFNPFATTCSMRSVTESGKDSSRPFDLLGASFPRPLRGRPKTSRHDTRPKLGTYSSLPMTRECAATTTPRFSYATERRPPKCSILPIESGVY